ncbi:MAG: 30S ribosomal protein S20 [Candidatus Shapirobacteria bacterium]|nr:30S ribosomal protein S20 [Candidatus Shapirobacteria bacterium]
MPISLSAKKSLRKSLKNSRDNVLFKTKLKLTVKKFLVKPTSDSLKEVYSILDKAVKKGIFHKNKTSRLKANYAKKVKNGTTATKAVVKKAVKKTKAAKSKSAKKM